MVAPVLASRPCPSRRVESEAGRNFESREWLGPTGSSGGLGDPRTRSLGRRRAEVRLALARIAERLVATRAWERLGFARLADYARERAGVSARQLQDLARTSARLRDLPRLEAALGSGRLGWS